MSPSMTTAAVGFPLGYNDSQNIHWCSQRIGWMMAGFIRTFYERSMREVYEFMGG